MFESIMSFVLFVATVYGLFRFLRWYDAGKEQRNQDNENNQ